MDEPHVWLNADESDIYEAPQTYKPKAEILQAIEPTAEVLAVLQPMYNFKAP